jgi:hypothetical protein
MLFMLPTNFIYPLICVIEHFFFIKKIIYLLIYFNYELEFKNSRKTLSQKEYVLFGTMIGIFNHNVLRFY